MIHTILIILGIILAVPVLAIIAFIVAVLVAQGDGENPFQ